MDIWHILLIVIFMLVGGIMVIMGIKKFNEERQHYSLKVKGKLVGFDTMEDAIARDIEKNQNNLDRINEMEKAKKSLKYLVAPIYEAEINGEKVTFKGKDTYRPDTERERAFKQMIGTANIYVNPNDYEDYITSNTVTLYPVLIFAGALCFLIGIGLIIAPI